jgi:cell division protein FtsB
MPLAAALRSADYLPIANLAALVVMLVLQKIAAARATAAELKADRVAHESREMRERIHGLVNGAHTDALDEIARLKTELASLRAMVTRLLNSDTSA